MAKKLSAQFKETEGSPLMFEIGGFGKFKFFCPLCTSDKFLLAGPEGTTIETAETNPNMVLVCDKCDTIVGRRYVTGAFTDTEGASWIIPK